MADDFVKKMADQQRKRQQNGGSTGTAGADDFVREMARKQKARNERNKVGTSAVNSAMEAIGDRAVLDFIEKSFQPNIQTPAQQKQQAQGVANQTPTDFIDTKKAYKQNFKESKMQILMQGERSEEVKVEKALMDMGTAEQKVKQLEAQVQQAEQLGAQIMERQGKMDQTYKNLMQLKQAYETTGDLTTGRAYLIAVEQYNADVEAFNKDYAEYQKTAKVYDSYNQAVQDMKKKQLDYDAAYSKLQTKLQNDQKKAEEQQTEKAGFWKTTYDQIGAGAGQFNKLIAQTVRLVAEAPMEVEELLSGSRAFTGSLLQPVLDWADWVIRTADAVKMQADQEAAAYGTAGNVAGQLTQGVIAALPSSLAAMLTGGGSLLTQLPAQTAGLAETARQAVLQMMQNPSYWFSALQTLGSSYEEALASGGTEAEALIAAVLNTLAGSAIEVSGGMEQLPKELQGADLSNGKRAWQWLKSGLEEGGEELIQNPLQRLINKTLSQSNVPYFSMTDPNAVLNPITSAQEFGSGATVGLILGGGQTMLDVLLNGRNNKTIESAETTEEAVKNLQTAYQNLQTTGSEADAAEVIEASRVLQEVAAREGKVAPMDAETGNDAEERTEEAPAEPRNEKAEGIQWAGSTPEIETERVVTNERTKQQAELGQSGNRAGKPGSDYRDAGQNPKRTAARATIRRAEEARRVQTNVQTLGGELTSLREQGLSMGSDDRVLTTVRQEAWTPEVESAWEIADSEGLEFVPLLGNMQVVVNGKTTQICAAIQNGKIYARADSTRQSIREAVLHEVFHEKARQDPWLVERVAEKIRQTYTREETQAMFERYADLYQNNFAGLTDEELENAIWEEMLADAYAEFQRYSDSFGTSEWNANVAAEVWNKEGKTGSTGSGQTKFSFAGENARTANLQEKARAQQMEQDGATPEEILKETGWFRGMDKKWRFEIDDSNMQYHRRGDAEFRKDHPDYDRYRTLVRKQEDFMLGKIGSEPLTAEEQEEMKNLRQIWGSVFRKEGKVSEDARTKIRLADYLEHDELFAAYPQLKDTRLVFTEMDSGVLASYDKYDDVIRVSEKLRSAPEKELIHEIQHAVQTAENFAGGSNEAYWRRKKERGFSLREFERKRMAAAEEYQKIWDSAPEEFREKVRELRAAMRNEDWDTAMILEDNIFAGEYGDLYSRLNEADFDRRGDLGEELSAFDLYWNTAGEIEARDAANRQDMTEEQRRENLPDLGDENVVFANDAKFSMAEESKRDIREELREKIRPGMPGGPHAVPGVETEVTGHIARPEGMSDEEYAELDAKWQERHSGNRNGQEQTPVEDLIIPKTDFTSTPAMDKLGIKIDGSVARYRQTEQLRAYEKAARQAQKILRKRIKDLKPSGQDLYLAKGIVDGNVTVSALDDDRLNVGVITEIADYMMAARSFSEDMIAQRRSEINTANLRIAETMFADAEAYNPKLKFLPGMTKLVMNERTPERVVKQIFGKEQGQKIYETYFRPVWVNGAEMYRFENRMLDRVEKFEDQNGTVRAMTEAERAMSQRLMEGEAAKDNVARLEADARERVESAAKNVNNGEEFNDAVREFNLQDEYHQGLVQAYADYLDAVTMSEDMDRTIMANAIREYQQIYNEMYDAINDFLVSHGYTEIGFIKGYAPHFQKQDAQQGLFGALKALGVEKESVSELPASIAGRTADFKPNMKWNPHMQGRKGSQTSYDIQEGFEQYLHYAAEMFYHTDDVMRVRQAVNWFRGQYSGEEISVLIDDAQVDRYKSAEWKQEFLEKKGLLQPGAMLDGKAINKLYDQYVSDLYERAKPENLQKYSEFVTWLDNYANIVAGKQSLADRSIEYGGGRNILNVGSRLMRAFSAANVGGNLSSVLNQSAQLPLIQKQLGKYLERAAADMARGGIAKDNFVERSDFLTDKRGVEKLTTNTAEKIISALFKPAELMDRLVSTMAVRGRYLQALSEGMNIEDAMKAADDFGRQVMGSRMKGAKPLGFESKTFVNQMLHVFQVEAANTFDYMLLSDIPQAVQEIKKEKGKAAASRYVAAFATSYLMNAFVLNQITGALYGGSPAPFDLVGWALQFVAGGFGRTDEEFLKTLIDNVWERMFGERPFETEPVTMKEGVHWAGAFDDLKYNVSNDIPYMSNIAGLLGWGDQTLPTVGVNEMFENLGSAGKTLLRQIIQGEEETGISWAGALGSAGEDLLSTIAMVVPGGRQIKKTVQGVAAVAQGGRYKGDRLQYPIDRTVWNAIQAGLFGVSALDAADAFYAAELSALTAGQTAKVKELEDLGIDRFTTYDLFQQFREIGKELTGAEASTAKRNAINNLDLSDQEKLEIYSQFILDPTAETYEKNRGLFQAMLDSGLTWDDVTEVNNLHAMLNEDEVMNATEKATEFAKWIDQQGWSEEQKTAAEEKFKFWNMMPAVAANYEKMEQAGVEAEKAADLANMLGDLEPEDGKETVTTSQKVLAIDDRTDLTDAEKVSAISAMVPEKRERLVEAGVSAASAKEIAAELIRAEARNGDEELNWLDKAQLMLKHSDSDKEYLAALSTVLQESSYQKAELADSYGVPAEIWVDFRTEWQETYGEDSMSQEKVENVLDGMKLTNSQKAVLWQISNKSWKPKNNPYDVWIGEEVYDELNEE